MLPVQRYGEIQASERLGGLLRYYHRRSRVRIAIAIEFSDTKRAITPRA